MTLSSVPFLSVHRALFALLVILSLLAGCDKAAEAPAGPATAAEDKELYTCGMHPSVVNEGPGSCPICGMTLTPMNVSGTGGGAAAPSGERKIKYWTAPMDPTYIVDQPGKSPMGMDLVPVYEDEGSSGYSASNSTIAIDPVMVQNMGVRLERVRRGPIFRHVRSIGEIEVAEDEVSVVNLRFSGWIEKIHVDETGIEVRKGEALFDVYSPELVSAQEEYLLAMRSGGDNGSRARSARARLSFWDVPDRVVEELERTGKASRTITVRAPRTGYVLHKDVVEGARVNAGIDLYRIGNLRKMWVQTEVYESDAPWVRLGQRATMELDFQGGEPLSGTVAYVYPTLNKMSRTLQVRLEFANPGLLLKPGMFATVRIETRREDEALIIPTEAIIHSGERELVFISNAIGRYEPRDIVTGLVGDRQLTQVLDGLQEGQEIVVSGQFLLDSESQLQEAINKLLAARLARKEGVLPDGVSDLAGGDASQGSGHWTCSMHPEIDEDGPGSCPLCGMDLVEKPAIAGHWTCPMHPQIDEDGPGSCPLCGMDLVEKPKPEMSGMSGMKGKEGHTKDGEHAGQGH